MSENTRKVVYTIREEGDRSYWTKVGVGFVNRDNSINLRLDALPTNGTLHVRDWEERQSPGTSNDRLPNEVNGAKAK